MSFFIFKITVRVLNFLAGCPKGHSVFQEDRVRGKLFSAIPKGVVGRTLPTPVSHRANVK